MSQDEDEFLVDEFKEFIEVWFDGGGGAMFKKWIDYKKNYIISIEINIRTIIFDDIRNIPIEFPPSPIRLMYKWRICAYDFWYIFQAFRRTHPPFIYDPQSWCKKLIIDI